MPENRCTNCITYNHECTYVEAAKVRRSSASERGSPPDVSCC